MCGIAGIVLKESQKVEPALLEKMAMAQAHRGPDSQDTYAYQNFGLAFRRLKIIDLSDLANQPLFNEDRQVAVVFNGEIYNFRELRENLIQNGHHFKSQSDTEVLVHGYEQWGEALFEKLNGMFAFTILDTREKLPLLYIVRDRFGIKPLFYSFKETKLAFASELKPLFHVDWIEKRVDPQTLFYYLQFSHVPNPLSILKDVHQLKPGRFLKFQKGNLEEKPYFKWDLKNKLSLTDEEALTECEGILKKVVTRQIISDVPVGCFLSGGIDSSLLAMAYAELQETQGKPIKTFTISYREKEFDEGVFAKEIAKAFRTDHYELKIEPKDLFEFIPKIPEYFDQPLADTTVLPTLTLAQFAKDKVTVALSGDGGDELFWGYPHQRALLMLNAMTRLPYPLRKGIFSSLQMALRPFHHKLTHQMIKLLDILQFENTGQFYQNFIGMLGPLQMPRLASLLAAPVDPTTAFFNEHLERLSSLDLKEKITQIFIETFLVDTVLAKTDRAGMAVGLEARVPFLDNEMAEFALRLPFPMKLRGGTSKYLLRKLLEKKLKTRGLSAHLSSRKKQGFSIPMRDWLRGELKFLLNDYLSPTRLSKEGVFQPQNVGALVKEHTDSKANHSHLLWSLLTFQMWKEYFRI